MLTAKSGAEFPAPCLDHQGGQYILAFGCACIWPLRLRDFAPPPRRPDARADAYRGLPACASLSMAGSAGRSLVVWMRA